VQIFPPKVFSHSQRRWNLIKEFLAAFYFNGILVRKKKVENKNENPQIQKKK